LFLKEPWSFLCCTDFSDEGSTEHELGKDLGAAMITASFDSEILTEEILRAIDPIPLDDIPMLNNNVEITDTFTEDNLRFGNM
jgi:Transducer of regulated CREB activity, C terminus